AKAKEVTEPQRSAQAGAHAGMVEELNTVELEGGADGVEIAAAGAGNRVEFFRPRDGGFRYAAELGKVLYRPAQESACRADLSARDCRLRRLHVSARAILFRPHIYLSRTATTQDMEVPAQVGAQGLSRALPRPQAARA